MFEVQEMQNAVRPDQQFLLLSGEVSSGLKQTDTKILLKHRFSPPSGNKKSPLCSQGSEKKKRVKGNKRQK